MLGHYETWMWAALSKAQTALNDVPVGCALVSPEGNIVITTCNSREARSDLLGHAELNALAATWRMPSHEKLTGYTLVTTLEPCVMCSGAIRETGIVRVVFGAFNPLSGAAGSIYDVLRDKRLGKEIEVIAGVLEKECRGLIDGFFDGIRHLSQ